MGFVSIFFIIYKTFQEHIVVSEKGIDYSRPGLALGAKREGISKIATYWRQGFRQECLLIDNSQVRIKKWSLGSIPGPFEIVSRNTILFPYPALLITGVTPNLGDKSGNTRHIFFNDLGLFCLSR
jgi:hypothetical protein